MKTKGFFALLLAGTMVLSGCNLTSRGPTAQRASSTSSREGREEAATLEDAAPVAAPLEEYPPETLEGRPVLMEIDGYRFYLQSLDGDFTRYQEGVEEITAPNGNVIMASPDGLQACVLGQYKSDGFGWGSISVIEDGVICYSNYESLLFVDMEAMATTGFSLAFHEPAEANWAISSVAYDSRNKEYIVLYNVSSYTASADGEYRPWMTYSNHEELGAGDARVEFQRFDEQGDFVDKVVTELEPFTKNGRDVSSYQPNRFRNGQLSFLMRNYTGKLVSYDFRTKELLELYCHGAILDDGNVTVTYQYNGEEGGFTYSWYERGKLVEQVFFQEEQDALTLGIDNAQYPLYFHSFDTTTRLLVMQSGNIQHRVNFRNGTGQVLYNYAMEDLELPLITSSGGRYEVYSVEQLSGAEGRALEVVSLDTVTEEITRIGVLNNPEDYFITAGGILGVRQGYTLYGYDLQTGEPVELVEAYATPRERVVGQNFLMKVVYDRENRQMLLFCTKYFDPSSESFSMEQLTNVEVYVYDEEGSLVHVVDTRVKPQCSQNAGGPYVTDVRLLEDKKLSIGQGNAEIPY